MHEEAPAVHLADVDRRASCPRPAAATAAADLGRDPERRGRSRCRGRRGSRPAGPRRRRATPPTCPTRPSPLITTGISPAAAARRRLLAAVLEARREHRRGTRGRGRAGRPRASGSSFARPPAARGGVDEQRDAAGRRPWPESSLAARAPCARPSRCPRPPRRRPSCSMPRLAKPQSRTDVGRVEGRRGAPARGDDDVAAGAQDAGDLGDERRHVELRDQVEGLVVVGELGGVGDPEGDPALGVEADLALAPRGSSARRCRPRERAPAGTRAPRSSAPSPVPVPTSSARSGAGFTCRSAAASGARCSTEPAPVRSSQPGRRAIEEAPHRAANRRPGPGRAHDQPIQHAARRRGSVSAWAVPPASPSGHRRPPGWSPRPHRTSCRAEVHAVTAASLRGRCHRPPPARAIAPGLAFALAALALASCGGGGGESTSVRTSGGLPGGEHTAQPKHVNLKPPHGRVQPSQRLVAAVDTSCGTFEIALDTEDSPKTVNSFVYLAERASTTARSSTGSCPDFVIQGGDPLGTGPAGPATPWTSRPRRTSQYRRGTVAMAKTPAEPPGRSGSQFFVVTAADAGLPPELRAARQGQLGHGTSSIGSASLGDPASGDTGTPTCHRGDPEDRGREG